jgi:hypothetical protein
MKKVLLLLAVLSLMVVGAGASTFPLQCGGYTGDAGANSFTTQTITCNYSITVPAGDYVSSVSLWLYDDYSLGNPGAIGSNSFTFNWTIPSTFNGGTTAISETVSNNNTNGNSGTYSPYTQPITLYATDPSTFPLTGSFSVSVDASGGTLQSSGTLNVTVWMDATVSEVPGVPEPATMGLIGAGLVALAFIRRRR